MDNNIILFDATSPYLTLNYKITGSDIYADSMDKVTISSVVDGSSVVAYKNESDESLSVYVKNKDSFGECYIETEEGELKFAEISNDGTYTLFEPSAIVNPEVKGHSAVFAFLDYFETDESKMYLGPVGVVFAEAPVSAGGYTRIEYGIVFSANELDKTALTASEDASWLKANNSDASGKYGIKLFGKGITFGETYYTLPYAKYIDSSNNVITIFTDDIITFRPEL